VNHNIPPPPVYLLYDTLKGALQSIQEFTTERGYAPTKLRSKNGKDEEVNRMYLQCDRGKFCESRVQERNRRIFRDTRFIDCPFSVILVHSKDIGAWVFEICNSGYNHISSSASMRTSPSGGMN